jgi:hypothetical protein
MNAFKFVTSMQKKPVQLKAVVVKPISAPQQKKIVVPKYQSTKLGKDRTEKLLGEATIKTK